MYDLWPYILILKEQEKETSRLKRETHNQSDLSNERSQENKIKLV